MLGRGCLCGLGIVPMEKIWSLGNVDTQSTRMGERRPRTRKPFFSLNFSCLAMKSEFYLAGDIMLAKHRFVQRRLWRRKEVESPWAPSRVALKGNGDERGQGGAAAPLAQLCEFSVFIYQNQCL